MNRTDEIREEDVGTRAGLFNIEKIGDEYWTFVTGCKDPQACTIMLRGGSKDLLNEVERNLNDAMNVSRNVLLEPRIVPGGGAVEMALSQVRLASFSLFVVFSVKFTIVLWGFFCFFWKVLRSESEKLDTE